MIKTFKKTLEIITNSHTCIFGSRINYDILKKHMKCNYFLIHTLPHYNQNILFKRNDNIEDKLDKTKIMFIVYNIEHICASNSSL